MLDLRRDKPFESCDPARTAVFEYVELFYHRIRTHWALDYRSPLQPELEYRSGLLPTCLRNAAQSTLYT